MSEETQNEDGYFTNNDGFKIARKYWKPEIEEPRALVYICHGVAEHYGAYDKFAKSLTDKGILVFSHDQVGHGRSEGDRCHITSYDKYEQDVVKHVTMMKEKYPNTPMFITGHSMGGAIALMTVLNHTDMFKGMVLVAPAILPSPASVTPFKVMMAKMVARLAPQMKVGSVNPNFICRDPEVVKNYIEDPLNYLGGMKAKWAVETIAAMDKAKKRIHEVKLPWLSVHGDQDKLTEISGSQLLYEKSESDDKTFTIYKGCYHQVHNEPDGEGQKCTQEIVTWIDSHI